MSYPEPRLDVLLEGIAVSSDAGHPAFCGVYLIEGPDFAGQTRRILVDPAHVGRRPVLWEELAKRGLGPTDIDFVVLTHADWDHVQNIDVFAHAPIFIHEDEYIYSLNPHLNDWATPAWTGRLFDGLMIKTVNDGDEIIPGVGIVEMVGHSPGSIGVTVATSDGMAIVTGDALHFAGVAVTGVNPLVFWNSEAASRSIKRVVDMADILYPGHDQPFRLTKDREIEYLYRPTVTWVGIDPSEPGTTLEPRPTEMGAWIMPGIEEQQAAFDDFKRSAAEQIRLGLEAGARDASEIYGGDDGHEHTHVHGAH